MALPVIEPADVKMEAGWKHHLAPEFSKPYFALIKQFLAAEKQNGKIIYPPGPLIFNAFDQTPFDKVRVVILGQDPYHGPGQAMGLCFSVPKQIAVPASLKNIYKEIARDIGGPIPRHGDLTSWAKQGVFLLNAILTVEQSKAGSHSKIGWQEFTDAVIRTLSNQKKGLIFLLWGNFARSKKELIDTTAHHVFEAAHPSPLARDAFNGCGHFSKTNQVLTAMGGTPIKWTIDE